MHTCQHTANNAACTVGCPTGKVLVDCGANPSFGGARVGLNGCYARHSHPDEGNVTVTSIAYCADAAAGAGGGNGNLAGGPHSPADCTGAGGTVVNIGGSIDICRFNASSCPSSWQQYSQWSTTTSYLFWNWVLGL